MGRGAAIMQTRLRSCSPPGSGSRNELLRLFPAGPGVNIRMPLTARLREYLPPSTLLNFGQRSSRDPKIPSGICTDEEVGARILQLAMSQSPSPSPVDLKHLLFLFRDQRSLLVTERSGPVQHGPLHQTVPRISRWQFPQPAWLS